MRVKKWLILLLIVITTFALSSCDYIITLRSNETNTGITSTYPIPVDGTITFEDSDYSDLPIYVSPTYSLQNINDYNDVLLNTQDHIRHANIEVYTTLTEERYPTPWANEPVVVEVAESSGSGFVFMEDANYFYAITNYHVIDPEEYDATYEIRTYSDTVLHNATLLAGDPELDLAVLRFDRLDRDDVEILDIYTRLYYRFNLGELVFAVGNPLSVTNNVTFGVFKGMEEIENVDFDVIYHDAAIHEGSSGGALVDVDGNLIGVNTWGMDSADVYAFSIPNYIVYMFLINYGILTN